MPIYEYRCRACGHEFERMQKVDARPPRGCPQCAGKVEKLISRTSFQLKGGGWFASDYGKPAPAGSGDAKPAKSGAASDGPAAPGDKPKSKKTENKKTENKKKAAVSD